MYILLDVNNRMRAFSPDAPFAPGFGETVIVAELPEYFDMATPMTGWLWQGGEWTYDPLPEPEPEPQLDDRVTAVEVEQQAQSSAIDDLIQALADMIGGASV